MSSRFVFCCSFFSTLFLFAGTSSAQNWPNVESVDRQPLLAGVDRVATALDSVGRPLSPEQKAKLEEIKQLTDDGKVVSEIQKLMDPLCLAAIHINPESRVKVVEGPTEKSLMQNGWRTFLVKVHNEAGINPGVGCASPQAKSQYIQSNGTPEPKKEITMADVKDRWLDFAMPVREPMKQTLSGVALEYRIIQLHSRDAGKREATFAFNIGQGTQDLGFRNEVAIIFDCQAAREVQIDVRDIEAPDQPMMVALEIRDERGRVYPNPARRLAPDFFFHNQIYRQGGESVLLPDGTFDIKISRGPEFTPQYQKLVVGDDKKNVIDTKLQRWIDPVKWNWYSGDHHVHAAGCAHYQNPTEGVGPDDMMRHVLGEDLKVGCVLSWGPCWYTQKEFFEGKTSALSTPDYLMRYDVEVSGFPSSHAGHLCLLRLTEDDFPGTTRLEQWPSWTLPVLKWGQEQGGVVGYSHSGWGLALPDYDASGNRVPTGRGTRAADKLPDYEIPNFDGIGANEFIVTVAHDACDFISTVDTPAIWELNIWYHTLNCGFRSRISGETDFPCIYGDRVGLGRVYVQLEQGKMLDFDAWVDGLKAGRSYCGDGLSHVVQFNATSFGDDDKDTVRLGWPGSDGKISQLNIDKPGKVKIETSIAAMLDAKPSAHSNWIRQQRLDAKPYWHIERARIGETRQVTAELIVNGQAVATKEITADGNINDLEWDIEIEKSSWVAVRILPSVHTNPIFIEVGGKPIRASKKSAQWCRNSVDACWNSKKNQIRQSEKAAAELAYRQAAKIYETIASESPED